MIAPVDRLVKHCGRRALREAATNGPTRRRREIIFCQRFLVTPGVKRAD